MTEKFSAEKPAGAGSLERRDATFVREEHEGVDKIYELKSELVNHCLQTEIGWGRYQTELFIVSGLGWAADNMWFQGVAIILPQITLEMNPPHVVFATLALYVGLICGATTWGVLADIIGRKLSWTITLFIAGVFGIAAGGAPNFAALGALIACCGLGVGGNLPVDGALYLEHIPQRYQWTLTLLSVWWAVGQLIASLVGWVFIANFSCPDTTIPGTCPRAQNNGWRYTSFTLGGITLLMFICRYFIFNLQESSKYLLAKGRDEEAIAVLQHIAKKNGKTITLTLEKLQAISGGTSPVPLSPVQLLRRALDGISLSHVKPLFATRRLAVNSTITIWIWGLIGLASPLFNAFLPIYLSHHSVSFGLGVNVTYRNYAIISVLGIPGSLIACWMVDWTPKGRFSFGGHKFAMATSTALTGVFLFLFTTAKNQAGVLAYSCVTGLTQNAMFGVLYAYTPAVFPAPHRGTADAVCSAFNRFAGLMAPIIATYGNLNTSVPVFVAASLFFVAASLMLFLPIEASIYLLSLFLTTCPTHA
ncbi:major facilitator superfamily domain-containing protein [Gautieria morchelliformis]|nr:major facilitator superfamily domain-containing protein [Gautieria morchelliformis]